MDLGSLAKICLRTTFHFNVMLVKMINSYFISSVVFKAILCCSKSSILYFFAHLGNTVLLGEPSPELTSTTP